MTVDHQHNRVGRLKRNGDDAQVVYNSGIHAYSDQFALDSIQLRRITDRLSLLLSYKDSFIRKLASILHTQPFQGLKYTNK